MRALPFNTLLLTCLSDETSHRDFGNEVRVERKAGETILLFVTDDKSNPNCKLKQDLQMGKDAIICDCIFFYSRSDQADKVLCLVELKGVDIEHAVERIANTQKLLKSKFSRSHEQHIRWRVYIHVRGSAPIRKSSKLIQRLESIFGKGGYDISHKSENLGRLLRK
jgi:hypothetical protein